MKFRQYTALLLCAAMVVGDQMGDDSPSDANNGWELTFGKYASDIIAALN